MTLWLSLMLAAAPALQVEGDLVKPVAFSQEELVKLGSVNIEWKDKKGEHKGSGVRLDKVLLAAGFNEGASGPKVDPKVKHEGLRSTVIALAPDGFKAVFSMGELLETLGATSAFVVWEMDGKPLPADVGPFRLIVTSDKGSSRSIYQLATLRVIDLKAR